MDLEVAEQPSAFAQIVDRLRTKSEQEMKLLYNRLLAEELKKEWKNITATANFSNCSEEDIVSVIQQNRYKGKHA